MFISLIFLISEFCCSIWNHNFIAHIVLKYYFSWDAYWLPPPLHLCRCTQFLSCSDAHSFLPYVLSLWNSLHRAMLLSLWCMILFCFVYETISSVILLCLTDHLYLSRSGSIMYTETLTFKKFSSQVTAAIQPPLKIFGVHQ